MTVEPDLKRFDFDPYFLMWNCVLFYPDPENRNLENRVLFNHSGNDGSIPCFQHKTCGSLVRCQGKYPPRKCPGCEADTALEQKMREARGESTGDPREAHVDGIS